MGTLGSQSGVSSTTPSISDLDGFTLRDYQFPPSSSYSSIQDDDFGFDPPQMKPNSLDTYQAYSPPNHMSLSGWPEFEHGDDLRPSLETPMKLDGYELDGFLSSSLPNTDTAVTRFGQVTPPRSHSAASSDSKLEEQVSPKSHPTECRKRGKHQPKEKDAEPPSATTTTTKSGRKRKSTRKSATLEDGEKGDAPEDPKRKQSLEKNRLAAAKCRVNKKEKTERLQRDSHEKAVENAYLKDQVMRMKDEIQQMNAILVAHANCEGCQSPEEIQAHLNALGNEFFNQQMALGHNFAEFSQMDFGNLAVMPDNFFAGADANPMLHPPLPEFDRSAEFEVHTPMQTD